MNKGKIAAIDSPENLKNTFKKSQSVEISFQGNEVPDLKKLPEVNSVEKRGDKYLLFTKNPGKVVEELAEAIKDKNINLNSIRTLGPQLEDVFVRLTGGELNDDS
jgi:ABC-2 type transport system ATP-binding protein